MSDADFEMREGTNAGAAQFEGIEEQYTSWQEDMNGFFLLKGTMSSLPNDQAISCSGQNGCIFLLEMG